MIAVGPDTAGEGQRPGAAIAHVAWVDIAKRWCIVLVVMMHFALGVGLALGEAGRLYAVVAFAKPFRMPDFFVIAGLFVGRAIALPWRAFLDRKVVHFLKSAQAGEYARLRVHAAEDAALQHRHSPQPRQQNR